MRYADLFDKAALTVAFATAQRKKKFSVVVSDAFDLALLDAAKRAQVCFVETEVHAAKTKLASIAEISGAVRVLVAPKEVLAELNLEQLAGWRVISATTSGFRSLLGANAKPVGQLTDDWLNLLNIEVAEPKATRLLNPSQLTNQVTDGRTLAATGLPAITPAELAARAAIKALIEKVTL